MNIPAHARHWRVCMCLWASSRLDGQAERGGWKLNACGVPVIGAPAGGIPELIEPGRNGLLLGPAHLNEIAAAVEEWMRQPTGYHELRATCRATAEARFDRNRMFDHYGAVFSSFVASPPRGQPANRRPGTEL